MVGQLLPLHTIKRAAIVMGKFLNVLIVILLSISIITDVDAQQETVNWMEMGEALKKAEQENKKIFIDLYTSWCSWCKKMDKSTFEKSDIASYINQKFIPVKFNAEQKSEIEYKGQIYKYVNYKKRGYHQLAAELSKNLGRLSYPTIIFLDEDQNVIQPIPGYQDPQSFEVIMHYIGDDHFKSKPFKSFASNFKGNYN